MTIMTLTKENFDSVIEANELVVIDFWAEWCAPCLTFGKIFSEVAEQYPNVIFGKINTEEEPHLATDFMIRSIPTVMILRQKVMVFREAGLLPKEAFEDLIHQAQALNMDDVRKQIAGEK